MFLCLKKIIFLCLKIYLFTQKKTRRVVVTRLVMGCGGGLVMTVHHSFRTCDDYTTIVSLPQVCLFINVPLWQLLLSRRRM